MKGPGIRLDLEVRRQWVCPECGKRRLESGTTVATRCRCTRDGKNMKLIEPQRRTRSFAEVIERIRQASSSGETKPEKQPPTADEQAPADT